MFFIEHGNYTHQYTLELILLSIIKNIASMRLNSSLWCDWGHWIKGDKINWLCTFFPKQAWDSKYRTLIQISTFDHIRLCFPHMFKETQYLHEFLSLSYCALLIATFISILLKNNLRVTTHFHMRMAYVSSHRSHLTSKDDNKIYLSISLASHLLHDVWIDSSISEAFLQLLCIMS